MIMITSRGRGKLEGDDVYKGQFTWEIIKRSFFVQVCTQFD